MTIGETISHYRVLARLGAGGMGEVFKAEDTRLKRAVALKFLSPALVADDEAKKRLIAEAQAASALDHPNICTIHEIDETADGRLFLAMAYYDGETLHQRLARGPLGIGESLDVIVQVARAVAAAHAAGIIHRDIKPANIFLCGGSRTGGGTEAAAPGAPRSQLVDAASRVKLLDFGIAKLPGSTVITRTGTTIGTVAYMSPEHLAGHAIDERADIWSVGVVLFELVAGRLPFTGAHEVAIMRAIEFEAPPPVASLRPDVPPELARIVEKALQKDPSERYESVVALLRDLEALRAKTSTATTAVSSDVATRSRRPAVRRAAKYGVAALIVAALGVGTWLVSWTLQAREMEHLAAEIPRLLESDRNSAALRLLYTAPPRVARDPAFAKLRSDYFTALAVTSDPPGADVYVRGYDEPDGAWIHLGQTPIETRGSFALLRWRVSKAGSTTFEGSGPPNATGSVAFSLRPAGTVPDDMVPVTGGPISSGARLPDFLIDRHEVTNRAFKRFVDAGGYRDREFWHEPFVKDGRTLTWDEATIEFRDSTGRPGPTGWELGTYPEGQDEWPVGGVSWYEAMAYARFAGKSLPTLHHWRQAAAMGIRSEILEWSNFSAKSAARVGEYKGLGPIGTYDMAGNVKEWTTTTAAGERRYILGGAWNEPNYMYQQLDARPSFDRSPTNGFRLVSLSDPSKIPPAAYDPVTRIARDYTQEAPADDDVFRAFAGLYAYDRTDLKPQVETVNDESEAWRVERVSYAAAYGNERIAGYLYLPKQVRPPYQTVVYFPHSGGFFLKSFEQAEMAYLGFLVKSGRALLFPMYKGLYERRLPAPPGGPNAQRDLVIQQVKDVSRSIDFLLTRADIAHDRLAFFGVSLGANLAPIVLAVEPRFKTSILWSGGFPSTQRLPENDPINFATRVRTPVLMLNGRDDFAFPVETSQEPMYRLLGTPAADKQRGLYDGGHIFPFSRMIKDSLDWLDRYLGVPR